jgi:hypothetical protein
MSVVVDDGVPGGLDADPVDAAAPEQAAAIIDNATVASHHGPLRRAGSIFSFALLDRPSKPISVAIPASCPMGVDGSNT